MGIRFVWVNFHSVVQSQLCPCLLSCQQQAHSSLRLYPTLSLAASNSSTISTILKIFRTRLTYSKSPDNVQRGAKGSSKLPTIRRSGPKSKSLLYYRRYYYAAISTLLFRLSVCSLLSNIKVTAN
jgi:hypothetical protein